jgi:hypothetical protein
MHVVIAKPLRTLGSKPEGMLLRDMHLKRVAFERIHAPRFKLLF